jgi:putative FmdB family regulatory protein
MPTYEYTCRDCGHTFDIVQSMWDEALTMCPECGGSLRKVFAPPAISFKGSGFYTTDHGKSKVSAESRSDGEKKAESKASDASTKSDGRKDASSKDSKGSSGGSEKSSKSAKKEPAPS